MRRAHPGMARNSLNRRREWRENVPWAELTHRRRVAAQWMLAGPFVLAALLMAIAVVHSICSTFGQECSPEEQREIDFLALTAFLILLPGPVALSCFAGDYCCSSGQRSSCCSS